MSAEASYKRTSGFITQLGNTCISIVKVLLRSRFNVKLPAAESNTCIVLGNGPSLKDSLEKHPSFFREHPLICVNSFSVTKEYTELKPRYYVMLDPGFWLGNNDLVKNTITELKAKTTWELRLLVPYAAKKSLLFQNLLAENKNIKATFFNYNVIKGFRGISYYFFRKNLGMMQSQNVLVAAIFMGINMGFKKIVVAGADHTWHENLHLDEQNRLCVKQVHFYENEEKISYVPFYKGVHTQEIFTMDEIFTVFAKVFYGYRILAGYAKSRDCKVLNASEVTFVDAFERIKL